MAMLAGKAVPAPRASCLSAERVPGPGTHRHLPPVPGAPRAGGGMAASPPWEADVSRGHPPWPPARPAVRRGCWGRCGGEQGGQGEAGGTGQRWAAWSAAQPAPGEGGVPVGGGTLRAGSAGGAAGSHGPEQRGSGSCKDGALLCSWGHGVCGCFQQIYILIAFC